MTYLSDMARWETEIRTSLKRCRVKRERLHSGLEAVVKRCGFAALADQHRNYITVFSAPVAFHGALWRVLVALTEQPWNVVGATSVWAGTFSALFDLEFSRLLSEISPEVPMAERWQTALVRMIGKPVREITTLADSRAALFLKRAEERRPVRDRAGRFAKRTIGAAASWALTMPTANVIARRSPAR